MPICQNCNKKWTWKQTIKRLFRLKCPHCGSKQYESASSRKKGSLFALLPILLLPINILLELSMSVAFILAIIVVFIAFCLYPFILKLSNEEEPII